MLSMALQMKHMDELALELWSGVIFSKKWKPSGRKEITENLQEFSKEQGSNKFL